MTTQTSPSSVQDRRIKSAFSHSGAIIAVCEDGTMWGWVKSSATWRMFPQPPVADEFQSPVMVTAAPKPEPTPK